MTQVPLCLNRVGEEVLLALGAGTAEDERAHRVLADELMTEIVHDIETHPDAIHDWSLLGG